MLLAILTVQMVTPWGQEEAAVPRVTIAEFKKLLAQGAVVPMDVRGPQSFALGHIPGAISVPLESIKARAAELKQIKKPIVAYCA